MICFNDLPDDCLFNILYFLEGGSLEVMRSVSRRIRRLANNRMFKDVKRVISEIRVQRNLYGDALLMRSEDGLSILHQFSSPQLEDASCIDNIRVAWRREDPAAYDKFILSRSTASDQQVPGAIAATISKYIPNSETRMLTLVDMVFSSKFLHESVKACRSSDQFSLVFDSSEFEGNSPDLYRLFLNACPVLMDVLYSVPSLTFINTNLSQIVQTHFVFEFGKKHNGGSLEVRIDEEFKYDNYYPSCNIVDVIVLYEQLVIPYLTLYTPAFIDLLGKAIEKSPTRAIWKFSLNSCLTEGDLNLIRNHFEIRQLSGYSNGMKFTLKPYNHQKVIKCETKSYRGKFWSEIRTFHMFEALIYTEE